MSIEELLRALEWLKVETGSLACLGCECENNCGMHGCRIIREAISCIRGERRGKDEEMITRSEVVKLLLEEIDRCRRAPDLNGCEMREEWQKTIDVCSIAVSAIREQEERENPKPLSAFLTPMDSYKGLKRKFLVFKSDTGEMVENCFVLRPDKDHAAVAALRAYADSTGNKTLAADIINWVGPERNDPMTIEELRAVKRDSPILVYAVCLDDKTREPDLEYGEWQIFNGCNFYNDETWDSLDNYGLKFIAYRRKPKEDNEQ